MRVLLLFSLSSAAFGGEARNRGEEEGKKGKAAFAEEKITVVQNAATPTRGM